MATFISYSRSNSDFAVRLAKDLEAGGFDVWFDQLDILAGSRWDDELEKALEKSTTFLVLLSPESIQSQNVKDEIGYAIDAGKHILPIVIKPCTVPIRLRRFQFVDFTNKSYEESLAEIKRLLVNVKELAAVTPAGGERLPQEIHPPLSKTPKSVTPRRLNTPVIVALLALIVIILGVLIGSPYLSKIFSPEPTYTPVPASATAATPVPDLTPTAATSLPVEITDSKGIPMALVPAGEFGMGNDLKNAFAECKKYDNDCQHAWFEDAEPAHKVYLDAYYIDTYEVTNASYRACVEAGDCQTPQRVSSLTHGVYYGKPEFDNHPVIYVDWAMANAYCSWRGGRLPTEAEWEKAARGAEDGRLYPWGNGIDCSRANYIGCAGDTNMVGTYAGGKSPYGLYDMAGNVWEWVADWYSADYYQSSPVANPPGPAAGQYRVLRGGGRSNSAGMMFTVYRIRKDASQVANDIGFRCARDANP